MPENPVNQSSSDAAEWKEQALNILAQLSHSLRNPFSTIQSYLNILEMEEYTYTPDGLKEITGILKETVEKSMRNIDEKMAELREGMK